MRGYPRCRWSTVLRKATSARSDTVTSDNFQIGYDATRYLARIGHKRIAIVCGREELLLYRERLRGYRKALADSGLPEREEYLLRESGGSNGFYYQIRELAEQGQLPDAIFYLMRSPLILGLSIVLCIPVAYSHAKSSNIVKNESVQSILQGRTIKGQIIDENNEPLIGVSVIIKGASTIGTITDFDGNYALEVPAGKNVLEISYIGYKTQEITIGKNTQLNIKMQPDTQTLDEVVVIGYGTVKKEI